jgi:protein-S-isoprenylcysteine O-methyltransferase Ste14
MRRAGTNVDPYHPTTAIVEAGPYRYTRNPLYVGNGPDLRRHKRPGERAPAALLLPVVLHLVDRGVIKREERYLEGKFGDEYLRYKGRVRRWI